jgi:hypothetical protein
MFFLVFLHDDRRILKFGSRFGSEFATLVLRQICAVFFKNFPIRDFRSSHENFMICGVRTVSLKNFVDMRKRNEP